MAWLTMLIKPASSLCNLRCAYCFYEDVSRNRAQASYGIMSEETQKCLIKRVFEYADEGVTLAFQGGEPLCAGISFFQRLHTLVEKYNVKNLPVQFTIQTNGTLFDEEWLMLLKEHRYLVGVSLDGVARTHDAYRRDAVGAPTHARVMDGIRLLQRRGIDFNILTVVNRRTAQSIDEIYTFYRQNGFAFQQYIACLDPLDGTRENHALSPRLYGQFLCRLFDLWYRDFLLQRNPIIRQFENWIALAAGLRAESCDQTGRCTLQCVIEANGDMYPCDFFTTDEFRLGNLEADDISTLLSNAQARDFLEHNENRDEECLGCRYFDLCRGGCARNRLEGKNHFCESYRQFFSYAGPRIRDIAEQIRKIHF